MSPALPAKHQDRYRQSVPTKQLIGWREWLVLPGLGIPGIKAKVDTGARTSALHATNTAVFSRNGIQWINFEVQPLRKKTATINCTAPLIDRRIVKDSGGHPELRYVIETQLSLGTLEWSAEVTLTDRDSMLFRMLLGRTAIRDQFLVDPIKSYLVGSKPPLATIYPD